MIKKIAIVSLLFTSVAFSQDRGSKAGSIADTRAPAPEVIAGGPSLLEEGFDELFILL